MSAPRTDLRRDRGRLSGLIGAGVIRSSGACDGKQSFSSQNDARHAAKTVARKTDRQTTTYLCPFCTMYHVTKFKHLEEPE